jgi:hypothetical protein
MIEKSNPFNLYVYVYLLAPTDCLQYFSSAAGRVRSFNWQDVAGTAAPLQLNNQNYNICFRTELVSGSVWIYFNFIVKLICIPF